MILPLMNSHSRLYHRNLFYTAVTRAKKLLIIIGRPEAVRYMVENNRKTLRFTNLARFLAEAAGSTQEHPDVQMLPVKQEEDV